MLGEYEGSDATIRRWRTVTRQTDELGASLREALALMMALSETETPHGC
jgi:hypothetical protein